MPCQVLVIVRKTTTEYVVESACMVTCRYVLLTMSVFIKWELENAQHVHSHPNPLNALMGVGNCARCSYNF